MRIALVLVSILFLLFGGFCVAPSFVTYRALDSDGYISGDGRMTTQSAALVTRTAQFKEITEKEVEKIMQQMQEGVEKPRPKVLWEIGEVVRVREGPFTDFHGAVEDVNYEKSKLRVSVTIFGRATPVELDFGQVEKT